MLLSKKIISSEKMANAYILSGRVSADGILINKPGILVKTDSIIEIKKEIPYVSRGALKLAEAVKDFKINLSGKLAIDFGASTGGFTDYLIKNEASRVIAVDVGYGQFAWQLRNNEKVFLLERTNIKNLELKNLPFVPDFAAADLSFISIKRIFKKIFELTSPDAQILLLIKPQFELEKELIENKGIIRSKELHIKAIKDTVNFFLENNFIEIKGISFSKIKGAKGNIEYWIFLNKINEEFKKKKDINYDKMIKDTVLKSHEFFSVNKI